VHDDLADPASDDPIARESSRLAATVGLGVQCSYDMEVWARYVYPPVGNSLKVAASVYRFYGFASPDDLKTPAGKRILADVSAIDLLTPDDPPMLLFSGSKDVPPDAPDYSDNHHPRHARALKAKADTLGVECEIWFLLDEPKLPEGQTVDDVVLPFLLQHLGVQ